MRARIQQTMRDLAHAIDLNLDASSRKPVINVTLGTAQYAHGYQRPDFVVASVVCAKGTYLNPQRNAKRKLVERMGIRQFKIQRRAFNAAQGAI